LQQEGAEVALLALLDSYPVVKPVEETSEQEILRVLAELLDIDVDGLDGKPVDVPTLFQHVRDTEHVLSGFEMAHFERTLSLMRHNSQLMPSFRPDRFEGDLLLFVASSGEEPPPSPELWAEHVSGRVTAQEIHCRHPEMCQPVHLTAIGRRLEEHLRSLAYPTPSPRETATRVVGTRPDDAGATQSVATLPDALRRPEGA